MAWRSVLVLAVGATACGRIDFDAAYDAGAGIDGSRLTPAVVGTASLRSNSGSTVLLPITPTQAAHLLVVATGNFSAGVDIGSIMDDVGNVYVSANARARWASPSIDVVEIWYAADSRAGATQLTITSPSGSTRDIWFMEVAGMDPVSPLDVVAVLDDGPTTQVPKAPTVRPTTTPSLVVSVTDVMGIGSGLDPASMFTALPLLDGNDTAFYITTSPGNYGAVWNDGNLSSYCASTAAFKPALQ